MFVWGGALCGLALYRFAGGFVSIMGFGVVYCLLCVWLLVRFMS